MFVDQSHRSAHVGGLTDGHPSPLKAFCPIHGDIHPIQYERAPLRVRCAMLRKHPPESPVLSCPGSPVSLTEFLFDERRIVSIAEEIPR